MPDRWYTSPVWQKLNPLLSGVVPRTQNIIYPGRDTDPYVMASVNPRAPSRIGMNPIYFGGGETQPVPDMAQTQVDPVKPLRHLLPNAPYEPAINTLAHESTHTIDAFPNVIGAKEIRRPNDLYGYGGPKDLTAYYKLGVPMSAFNIEQRAAIVEGYFKGLQDRNSPEGQNLGIYAHYMQQLKTAQIKRQEQQKYETAHPFRIFKGGPEY